MRERRSFESRTLSLCANECRICVCGVCVYDKMAKAEGMMISDQQNLKTKTFYTRLRLFKNYYAYSNYTEFINENKL